MTVAKPGDAATQMLAWRGKFPYRQQLGSYDATIDGILRPDPTKVGYGDCTSTIQHAYLKKGGPNPGYYTEDMLGRGKRVNSSANPNWNNFQAGDIVIMRWPSGVYHAEMVADKNTLVGHPGPGRGPRTVNLRYFLGLMSAWWVQRHDWPNNPTTSTLEEETVQKAQYEDSRLPIVLQPGEYRHLAIPKKAANRPGTASNVARFGAGAYILTAHVYAKGTADDQVDVRVRRQKYKTTPKKNSTHWATKFQIGRGTALINTTFTPTRHEDEHLFIRVTAPKTNKQPITITTLAVDSTRLGAVK